jgi:hypothetical protein
MDVRFLGFGSIEVEGRAYEHDIVIDRGAVRKRSKKPSKPYRDKFGHTPLSADEELPWGGPRLIIGTGAHGSLPIMPEVVAEAARCNVDRGCCICRLLCCERICERNVAQLPRWRETRRDAADGRLVVTCPFETREATRNWDRLAHNPEVAGSNPVPATKMKWPPEILRGPFSRRL